MVHVLLSQRSCNLYGNAAFAAVLKRNKRAVRGSNGKQMRRRGAGDDKLRCISENGMSSFGGN